MPRGEQQPPGHHDEAGVQRFLDAWRAATLADRNAFLWLAAEEIQAAADGEFLNALTTPEGGTGGSHARPSTRSGISVLPGSAGGWPARAPGTGDDRGRGR